MKKRIEKRTSKGFLVDLNKEDFQGMGVISNISKSGMLILTTDEFPPQTRLTISISIGGDVICIEGEVAWCENSPEKFSSETPYGVGIKICEVSEEYLKFVEGINLQGEEKA